MNVSKRGVYIGIIVCILAVGAVLWGLPAEDGDPSPTAGDNGDEMPVVDNNDAIAEESISWNEAAIEDEAGNVLVASDDVPTSIQVSADSEFGAAGPFSSASLAPEAGWIAFTTSGAAHGAGWLYEMDTEEVLPVAFQYGGDLEVIEWSPDGRFIAFAVSSPAGTNHLLVVDTENTDGYVSEISQPVEAEAEAGMNPPFAYEFAGWEAPHTLCYSFEGEDEECVEVEELFSGNDSDVE